MTNYGIAYANSACRPAANGFVTMDISKDTINVEYYARDMEFENGDLYPVDCDLKPSYSFQITQKAT
jgi:tartrate-resistant acid phosphatase type 5